MKYLYLIAQWEPDTDSLSYSKTGYTDINRAQSICDRLNREYHFFVKWEKSMNEYVNSNIDIISLRKEISDYEIEFDALYSKEDNKSKKLCSKIEKLLSRCYYKETILRAALEKEWKEITDFNNYTDANNYYQYSLHKIKVK